MNQPVKLGNIALPGEGGVDRERDVTVLRKQAGLVLPEDFISSKHSARLCLMVHCRIENGGSIRDKNHGVVVKQVLCVLDNESNHQHIRMKQTIW